MVWLMRTYSMAHAVTNRETDSLEPSGTQKPRLIYPKMGLLFASVVGCFTAWGIAADLTTPMVAGFKHIFEMSTFQASLVQLAYFGAYFLLALPAAFLNRRSEERRVGKECRGGWEGGD